MTPEAKGPSNEVPAAGGETEAAAAPGRGTKQEGGHKGGDWKGGDTFCSKVK